jgi:hypothetical protein
MAASTTTNFSASALAPVVSTIRAQTHRRQRITPQAGRALEILGHAIEYLADEFVFSGRTFSASDEQIEAVQILMACNREVYFECPERASFAQSCRALFHLR